MGCARRVGRLRYARHRVAEHHLPAVKHHRQARDPDGRELRRQALVRQVAPQLRRGFPAAAMRASLPALRPPGTSARSDSPPAGADSAPPAASAECPRAPSRQLHLRAEYEVDDSAQIGGQKPERAGTGRHYLLAGDVVADPRLPRDRLAQELQHRPPLAVVGHLHQQLLEAEQVDPE